jgi:hypothetical protein
MKKTIERLELTNYRLYVFISLLIGIVIFVLTFFLTSRIATKFTPDFKNKADQVFTITNISEIGFDVEINSSEEVKVRYFFGKTTETLTLFFESKDFVKEETQQFRSIVPDTNNFVQIEIETRSGEKTKSQIINVNDMIK